MSSTLASQAPLAEDGPEVQQEGQDGEEKKPEKTKICPNRDPRFQHCKKCGRMHKKAPVAPPFESITGTIEAGEPATKRVRRSVTSVTEKEGPVEEDDTDEIPWKKPFKPVKWESSEVPFWSYL